MTSDDVDSISDLPNSLISHILSFLPTKLVVATSVLSTRWKPLWKTVPSIEFRYAQSSSSPAKFVQNVNNVIMLRNPEILDKVLLEGPVASEEDAVCVNTWLRYAIPKNLRSLHLTLQTGSPKLNIEIPKDLLKCAALESLKLLGPFTFQLPNVVRLPRLQVLDLGLLLRVSNEFINNLVSGCPVIRSVNIYRNRTDQVPDSTVLKISSPSMTSLDYRSLSLEKLKIDAPNLEFLFLLAHSAEYCCMKVPSRSLNRATLKLLWNCCADSSDDYVHGRYNIDRCNSTVKLFKSINRAKCLILDGLILKAISNATIPLSTRFERLTSLDVNAPCCSWGSISLMLACFIKLQRFSMSTHIYGYCGGTHKRGWEDPKEVPQCLVSSLSHVSLKTFLGLDDEMSMVRYFLKHGSVLESVNVTEDSYVSANKLQILQAISKFPRLSTACSVEFD